MGGGWNSHLFTGIKTVAYIRPVKVNAQMLNGRKASSKGFGLVIIKIPKTNMIIPLWSSYYMPQNPQNTISQTALRHYNELRSVRTGALVWVNMNTDIWIKLKVETTVKYRYQQLLDFITIDVLKIEQQHLPIQYIITLPMTPIINGSFNKQLMSSELIHHRIINHSESVLKAMCHHQTLYGLPNHCLNKIKRAQCKICYTEKMTTLSELTTVDRGKFKLGELIYMEFGF